MALRATISFRGDAAACKKDLRPAAKAALAAIGELWHDRILPGHFTEKAKAKYKYRKRGKVHTDRKRRLYGHEKPLVFSGEMQRDVTRMARITSTARGARVAMSGPRYLYAYRKDYNQPDKAAEIIAVTAQEANHLAEEMDRLMTERLNKNAETRTVRIT